MQQFGTKLARSKGLRGAFLTTPLCGIKKRSGANSEPLYGFEGRCRISVSRNDCLVEAALGKAFRARRRQ